MHYPRVVTHSGDFHPDDVYAVTTLSLVLGDLDIVRTRESEKIADAEYVVDVGGVYSPSEQRFDHHQGGGAGVRPNGVPYASFGLVWKEYGERVCGSTAVAMAIDAKIVQPVDAMDNGVMMYAPVIEGVKPYLFDDALYALTPTWKEDMAVVDERFKEAMVLARMQLTREIQREKDRQEGWAYVEDIYTHTEDKRIIVLPERYPWKEVLQKYPEPLFVVYPRPEGSSWQVKTVRKESSGFESRKDLPIEWAGKHDAELAEITGVPDAVFCHNKRFIAVAASKEGAIALARRALEA